MMSQPLPSMGCRIRSRLHELATFAAFGEFVPVRRLDALGRDEWMAMLADRTEIVVSDAQGRACAIGARKAASIIENRIYFEARARQLLIPLAKNNGEWCLITIDFGMQAQRHDCEFLMCFAFQESGAKLSCTSPYVEVAFRLAAGAGGPALFVLMIQTQPSICEN